MWGLHATLHSGNLIFVVQKWFLLTLLFLQRRKELPCCAAFSNTAVRYVEVLNLVEQWNKVVLFSVCRFLT